VDTVHWLPMNGLQRIPVDLFIDGRPQRRLGATLDVHLAALQWCADASLAEGTSLDGTLFARCWQPPPRSRELIGTEAQVPAGRLRHALRAGEALLANNVAPPGTALAGDQVAVRCRQGAVELEARGELEQDAHVGDAVRVRVRQADRPAVGRLVAPRIVELESQP
jgi:hypothetical protein